MQTFIDWARDQGIISNAATIQQTEYAEYGLFATQDMTSTSTAIEAIVFIPGKLLITANRFFQEHPLLKKEIINEKQALRLFLIYGRYFSALHQQQQQQEQTNNNYFWKPYIDILPTVDYFKKHHILFNVSLVKGTNLEQSIHAKLCWLENELKHLQEQCFTEAATHWIHEITLDMYFWADCVVWSRVVGVSEACQPNDNESNDGQSNLALIPFFDFANHSSSNCNIRWQWIENDVDSTDEAGIQLVPYTDKNISIMKGDELLLSYGSKSNQELLFLYGFCVENNPTPINYTLSILPFLDANEPMGMFKSQWLKQLKVKPLLTFMPKLDVSDGNDKDTALENEHKISLHDIGLTGEDLSIIYLIAADDEIGSLEFSYTDNAVADDDSCSTTTTTKLLTLTINAVKITSIRQLAECIEQQQKMNLPIIQLRIVLLLIDALEYQLSTLTISSNEVKKFKESVSEGLIKQMDMYRQEEQTILTNVLGLLYYLRDKLSSDPIVVDYLK
ncbi:hypothetical protein BDF20DRAFT_838882 [Mycotypha africana]|uniref:uncharacterized protein n=1 Tax=Mycotypha africana TaxID=64632 RepID=UPI002300F091|nr:uncharacterized protein BDF20DRAFT_838882 [Mycotypha africana]KAI8968894.1 hypothetical protein BDF20DRAFT_838882 [Mycotypha africana]